jgi:nitrogen fixation/metabolism regulation signal transduction histidine kinase
MFLAILVVALVPAAVALAAGVLVLRQAGSATGTLGPWDAVAESGEELIGEAGRAAPGDTALARAAETHRADLSESLRRSRLWSFMTGRVQRVLPLLGLSLAVVVAMSASLAAGRLSRTFSRPVSELVDWTERIARFEPLPPEAGAPGDVLEFARLRESLRRMADELGEARRRELEAARLRAWTDMARRVAHELKNPLTPMRLAATTLARDQTGPGAEAAHVLLEEIGRLDEMARSFAQLGRMPEGPPSEVDLEELLADLARRHATDDLPIRVTRSGEVPLLVGHYEVLRRLFGNLLVNAVEASVTNGTGVEVTLRRSDGEVRVAVRDHGAGIPEEMLEAIWLPDVTTRTRGTGLGLALVRQGAAAHGGRARARNVEGGGAEFEVVLPLRGGSGPVGEG